MSATEPRTTYTREERDAVEKALIEAFEDDRRQYGRRVLQRLESKPRYQSIGKRLYVYVEDVREALEREAHA